MDDGDIQCPYCGEPGAIEADDYELEDGEPGEHRFVQDCAVCCRPWAVCITVGSDGEVSVVVDRA